MKLKALPEKLANLPAPDAGRKSKQKNHKTMLMALSALLVINTLFTWCEPTGFPVKFADMKVEASNQTTGGTYKNEAAPSPALQVKTVTMSAYTSRVEETDSTPCISADGTNICRYDGCIVASNDYPFDTVLYVEGFGECVVKDRMSSRYTGTGNMDLYFGYDLEGALEFGRKDLKIKVTT